MEDDEEVSTASEALAQLDDEVEPAIVEVGTEGPGGEVVVPECFTQVAQLLAQLTGQHMQHAFEFFVLLTAPWRAEEPAKGDSTGTRLAQGDRSRGFWGFPDWDSRSGGYDRSRRAEADDKKPQDGGGGSARSDDRRGPPGDPRSGGPGP